MMGGYSNPFDRPLDSEIQEHQQAQATTVKASPIGNPFDEPLLSEKAEAQGQITNDVGNTVIVPKEGESFADTMKRAAAYGKTVTPQQINTELATAPKKAAETVAAAPLIGAGGAAALSGLGELIVNSPEIGKAVIKPSDGAGNNLQIPCRSCR
jgi:hypothetical protein